MTVQSTSLVKADRGAFDATAEPLARLHRLLLSLFGSSEQFRRWLVLGPCGQALVAELTDRPTSTSAALLDGIDTLARRGHIDRGFFARLADEFPRRADEIRLVATSWMDPARSTPGSTLRRRRPLALVVPLLALLLVSTREAEPLPCAAAAHVEADDAILVPRFAPVVVPDSEVAAPRRSGPRPPRRGNPAPLAAKSDVALPPAPACVLPPSLADELAVLANEALASAAIVERFTIILHAGASAVAVSPRPLPGQAPRRRIHERLLRIGPGALDECRDTPVDIALSLRRATITPRLR